MEKRKAHYPLAKAKELIRDGSYRVTNTALSCAIRDFGLLDASQVAANVLELETNQLYKSMTTLRDSKLWQDVYHARIEGTLAYIKIQILDEETVVISFKRLEDC